MSGGWRSPRLSTMSRVPRLSRVSAILKDSRVSRVPAVSRGSTARPLSTAAKVSTLSGVFAVSLATLFSLYSGSGGRCRKRQPDVSALFQRIRGRGGGSNPAAAFTVPARRSRCRMCLTVQERPNSLGLLESASRVSGLSAVSSQDQTTLRTLQRFQSLR